MTQTAAEQLRRFLQDPPSLADWVGRAGVLCRCACPA